MTQHPRQLQTRARLHAIVFTLAVFFLMLTATGCEHTHPLAEHEHHHTHQHEHTQEPLAEVLRKEAEALHRELVGKHRLESLEKIARRGGVEQRRLSLSDQMPEFKLQGQITITIDYKFTMYSQYSINNRLIDGSWWIWSTIGGRLRPFYYRISPTRLYFYVTPQHRSAGYDIPSARLKYKWNGEVLTLTHFYGSRTGEHPTYSTVTTTKWRKVGAK